jgi:hypothetical protein
MHATEYVAAEGTFETQVQRLSQTLPQTEPAKTVEPPLFPGVLTRWKLVKKNGALALNSLLGHKEIH